VRQVLQNRSGLTVVRDVPAPPCGPGSVLVRTAFSAISAGTERSRVELSQKSILAKARERPDLVREVVERARREGIRSTREAVSRKLAEETPVGYSSAGFVLEVGAGVRDLQPGDQVACAGGEHANHAEIVSVPANLVAKVPDGIALEAAAMTTIAAIPLHGIRLAGVTLGESVAVIGCGLVGQIACRLLRAAGAYVLALDIDPLRVEQARASGADRGFVSRSDAVEAIRATTGGVGVDHVLVTAAAPSNDPLLLATEIARDRATLVLVGDVPVEFPRAPLYDKELSFRVSRSYGPGRYDLEYEERGLDYPIGYVRWTEKRNMECVLELQANGRLRLSDLIEVVPVEGAPEAYERLLGPSSERPPGTFVLAYDQSTDGVGATPRRTVAAAKTAPAIAPRPVTEPIRVGLIGPGNFAGRVLVPALVAGRAELEVVGGGSGPSAEAAARTLGFARAAETAEAVIGDESVNAVVIATRHGSHAALARQALEAGKHVFCEKPLALTLDELTAVREAADHSGAILAVGFNRRFAPLLGELREFVLAPPSPVAATYRVSAGHFATTHWVHDLEQGGGRILGEVCHFVDSLAFVTDSEISEVHSAGYGDPQLPVQARDNVTVTLGFANGSIGSILYVADGSTRVPKERLEAFSGERTAILDDYRTLELFGPNRKDKRGRRTQDKGHRQEIASFLRGIERGEPPVPLAQIANVSLATLAVVESLRTGQSIRVAAL
jgi:predicted dehydrogenase/threonine dehydrogenase-like Zn-dependent dehydrogenase